jgi:hypothetical protein
MQSLIDSENSAAPGLIHRCLRWWGGGKHVAEQPRPATDTSLANLAGKWPDPPVWLMAKCDGLDAHHPGQRRIDSGQEA